VEEKSKEFQPRKGKISLSRGGGRGADSPSGNGRIQVTLVQETRKLLPLERKGPQQLTFKGWGKKHEKKNVLPQGGKRGSIKHRQLGRKERKSGYNRGRGKRGFSILEKEGRFKGNQLGGGLACFELIEKNGGGILDGKGKEESTIERRKGEKWGVFHKKTWKQGGGILWGREGEPRPKISARKGNHVRGEEEGHEEGGFVFRC